MLMDWDVTYQDLDFTALVPLSSCRGAEEGPLRREQACTHCHLFAIAGWQAQPTLGFSPFPPPHLKLRHVLMMQLKRASNSAPSGPHELGAQMAATPGFDMP